MIRSLHLPLSAPAFKRKPVPTAVYKSPFGGIPEVTKGIKEYVLQSVETNIERGGDQDFIIDSANPSKKMTYTQLKETITAIEAFLHSIGFEKGSVATGFMTNCVEYPAIYTAIVGRGGIFTGPTESSGGWMSDHLTKTSSMLVFVTPENLENAMDEVAKSDCVKAVVLVNFKTLPSLPSDKFISFEQVVATEGHPPPLFVSPDDVAVLAYTSGSTGPPKLTMLTHRNLMSCMFASEKYQLDVAIRTCFPELATEDRRKMLDVRYVNFMLYAHLYGMMWMLRALTCAIKIAVCPLQPQAIIDALHKYKPWHVTFSPLVLNMLLPRPDVDLSFVRHVTSSATALRPAVVALLKERYPQMRVVPGIGMTEMAGACMNMPRLETLKTPVYVPSPGVEARLLNEDGHFSEPYEWGELLLKGPTLMKGYFKNEKDTKASIDKEGWYHTGDICYINEKKEFVYVDRVKAIILVGRDTVSSFELERILMDDGRLKDVMVLGVPHDELGQVVKAFVVRKDDSLTAEEVIEMVEKKTSEKMWLKGGVEFVEEIPRDKAGKPMRYTLRKRYNL